MSLEIRFLCVYICVSWFLLTSLWWNDIIEYFENELWWDACNILRTDYKILFMFKMVHLIKVVEPIKCWSWHHRPYLANCWVGGDRYKELLN